MPLQFQKKNLTIDNLFLLEAREFRVLGLDPCPDLFFLVQFFLGLERSIRPGLIGLA